MNKAKHLIVNADDFGLTTGINDGIIQAHEQGILTSASLMVRKPAAKQAAAYGRRRIELSVGLHVDLCEWQFTEGSWSLVYERVPAGDIEAVRKEVASQLEVFRSLMGREPTHLDSHQHVHRDEPLRSILLDHARRLRISLRSFDSDIRYCGEFYGQSDKGYPCPQAISAEALVRLIMNLPPGTTELGCHPGFAADLESGYRIEREVECQSLCDQRVRTALDAGKTQLCSFASRNGISPALT